MGVRIRGMSRDVGFEGVGEEEERGAINLHLYVAHYTWLCRA